MTEYREPSRLSGEKLTATPYVLTALVAAAFGSAGTYLPLSSSWEVKQAEAVQTVEAEHAEALHQAASESFVSGVCAIIRGECTAEIKVGQKSYQIFKGAAMTNDYGVTPAPAILPFECTGIAGPAHNAEIEVFGHSNEVHPCIVGLTQQQSASAE
jgi:hypothetical protein